MKDVSFLVLEALDFTADFQFVDDVVFFPVVRSAQLCLVRSEERLYFLSLSMCGTLILSRTPWFVPVDHRCSMLATNRHRGRESLEDCRPWLTDIRH